MNVLDENIFEHHRQQLEAWNIHVRQVGVDIGKLGMDDREEIIPPVVRWQYDYRPEPGTRQAEAWEFFHPRDWLKGA